MKDTIVESVRQDLLNRSMIGVKKYQVTLDREDIDLKDWLQHQYEELLDAALYCKRAIKELRKEEVVKWNGEPLKVMEDKPKETLDLISKYFKEDWQKQIDEYTDLTINAPMSEEDKKIMNGVRRLSVNELLSSNNTDEEYYPDRET